MTLRARLLVGYGYLVALLVIVAGSAAVGFLGLSASVEEVIEDNFRSIQAAMTMMDALERQDSVTLAALIEGQADEEALAEQEEGFLRALDVAAANVTEPDEPEVLAAIRDRFETFVRSRNELIRQQPGRPLAAYRQEVFPLFLETKEGVLDLLEINQDAILEADRSAREAAIRSGTWIGFLVVVALVSLVFLSRALQRQVLQRLQELRVGVASLAAGQHRRLREEGSDELALVAQGINGLLDRYEELEGRSRGRIARERRLVLGLVGAFEAGTLLFGVSGELLVEDADGGGLENVVSEWIREEGHERAKAGEPVRHTLSSDGKEVTVDLLLAPGGRPAGWLARPE